MNSGYTKMTAVSAAVFSAPAFSHAEHGSVLEGIAHFMTEPDHLALSAIAAAAIILAVRKLRTKRS